MSRQYQYDGTIVYDDGDVIPPESDEEQVAEESE